MKIHSPSFTLIECLIASAILSVTIAAVTQAVTAGQMQAYTAMQSTRAVALAEVLIEEIIAHPYADLDGSNALGPEAGETRATFSSADDYHGLTQSINNLTDPAGTPFPDEYQSFSRSVSIAYASQPKILDPSGTIPGLDITITVIDSKNHTYTLTSFLPKEQ